MNPTTSGNGAGTYNYTTPNINTPNIPNQNINGSQVGGYNFPDLTSISAANNANSQNFNQSQQNTIGNFQSGYQASVNALPTFQQLNQQANNQYNVPNLQTQATNLNNTVLQIPQTYSQATQGSDTNNNQLQQLIGQKQWELDPLAQAATNSAQTAQGLANTSVGYGIQNEQQQLAPWVAAGPMIQNQLASAAANFTQQQSDQLATLQAMVQAGTQLSASQAAQMTSLSNAKTAYDQAVAVANISAQAQIKAAQLNNENYTLNPYQQVYNTTTGQAHTNTL